MPEPLRLCKSEYVAYLHEAVPSNCQHYRGSSAFPLDDNSLLPSTVVPSDAEPPTLYGAEQANKASTDADAAVKLYEYLGPLSLEVAADKRLWVYLSHATFFDYCRWRWMGESPDSCVQEVRTHWFTRGEGLAGLRRNGVARLWWAAALTVAPWERDKELTGLKSADRYKFTRILLSNQDIYQALLERSLGMNLRVRIVALDALERMRSQVSNVGILAQRFGKQLNLVSSYTRLAALDTEELRKTIDKLLAPLV